jgi:hypothetical protein
MDQKECLECENLFNTDLLVKINNCTFCIKCSKTICIKCMCKYRQHLCCSGHFTVVCNCKLVVGGYACEMCDNIYEINDILDKVPIEYRRKINDKFFRNDDFDFESFLDTLQNGNNTDFKHPQFEKTLDLQDWMLDLWSYGNWLNKNFKSKTIDEAYMCKKCSKMTNLLTDIYCFNCSREYLIRQFRSIDEYNRPIAFDEINAFGCSDYVNFSNYFGKFERNHHKNEEEKIEEADVRKFVKCLISEYGFIDVYRCALKFTNLSSVTQSSAIKLISYKQVKLGKNH